MSEPGKGRCIKDLNSIVLFTGIANPAPLQEHLRRLCVNLESITFPDHHQFREKDIDKITDLYNNLITRKKIILTTEKDAMRLKEDKLFAKLEDFPVFYLPIDIKIHESGEFQLVDLIKSYVGKNKGNSELPGSKDKKIA